MTHLFSPVRIGVLLLKNRIVIAPMCMFSAADGQATDWHLMYLGNLALSDAGLLIIESTAVLPEGRITYGDLRLWDKNTEEAMAKVIHLIHLHSPMPVGMPVLRRKVASLHPMTRMAG